MNWRWGAYSPGMPWTDQSIVEFTNLVDGKPPIVHFYRPFSKDEGLLWDSLIDTIEKFDVQPMITWEPWDAPLIEIASGQRDDQLVEAANWVKKVPRTVLFRFAHEMNGDWYPWGKQPSVYKVAYCRVVNIFRKEGATNARFVWCPNIMGDGIGDPLLYYPGDNYVHWLAMDGYNWNTPWRSLGILFAPTYNRIKRLAIGKPMMIAETSSREGSLPAQKAGWIRNASKVLSNGTLFPRVKTALWFNSEFADHDDWTIDSSPESLKAFKDTWVNK